MQSPSRLKREAERIKEQKFKEQQAAILSQRKKEDTLRTEIERLLQSITNETLGLDRNYCRYWLFTSGTFEIRLRKQVLELFSYDFPSYNMLAFVRFTLEIPKLCQHLMETLRSQILRQPFSNNLW